MYKQSVTDIRVLRLSRGLTLIDLALLADIPARRLAELEHGMQPLDLTSRTQLANIFGLPAEALQATTRTQAHVYPTARWMQRGAYLLIAVVIGMLWAIVPTLGFYRAASAAAQPAALNPSNTAVATPISRQARPLTIATSEPQASAAPMPSATAIPPTATPRFTMAADGPHGCPLAPPSGHVVITQGYDQGTHLPTNVWGAVDLGIDADGDGSAEPATTQGAPVAATIGGVAHVYLGSWPGGNYVRIVDTQAGWSSAYAHLDSVAVTDGQAIGVGMVIGTTGSTGMASGPHLHYEVWHGDANVDPTGLIECR